MTDMPSKILLATRNQGKVREIQALVKDLPIEFVSLDDVPAAPTVEEDGRTFEENALKKARVTAEATGIATLADDSGLCVDALDGRPGVLSARYAGEDSTDQEKCHRILQEMIGIPEQRRTARFICVLALVMPDGRITVFQGICEGRITFEPRGEWGFGYDPIFWYEEADCTFAEMDKDAKNRVSHRGKALQEFATYLGSLQKSINC